MPARLSLGIIVNPRARHARDKSLPDQLSAKCQAASAQVTLALTRNQAELRAAVAKLQQERVDVLAVCGGDGTLMTTMSAIIELYKEPLPPILLLPGGTMNTVAHNLGVVDSPLMMLSRLLRATSAQPGLAGLLAVPRARQAILRVTSVDEQCGDGFSADLANASPLGTSCVRYGHIFSAAMGARYLSAYARRPGLPWAAWLGLRTIGSCLLPGGGAFARWLFERTSAALTIDGELSDESAFRLILCATVANVGLGMRVPWQAGRVPGRFQIIASSLPILANVMQIGRMQRGQPLVGQPHIDRMAQAATIRFAQTQPLTLDGELFAAREISIGLGPTLEILLPP